MRATNVIFKKPAFDHRAPGNLLIEIALFLETSLDILNFCLTSHHVLSNVSSLLYETVVLTSAAQCESTLGMLMRRTDIARHVRHLVVRPHAKPGMIYNVLGNELASANVRRIAGAMALDALKRFDWDDDELPFYEDMWFALRIGCPRLRYIAVSIGLMLPRLHSHLLDFQNLTGFSLTLKHKFYENNIDIFLEETPVFQKLWDMLIVKCPNLEELVLDGISSVPADIHYIVEGRWPKLRKLSLGDVCVDWFPMSIVPNEKRPFITFLEDHPLLESLKISRHTIQPHHFSALDSSALERVTSFSGTLHQLQAIPHLHPHVKSVSFCDPVELREISSPPMVILLRDLKSLVELRISFTVHSLYDSGNLLKSLVRSCPNLRHLELTCGHKPSFHLDSFAKGIRAFPKLRLLHLTIVKHPSDGTLVAGATRISQSNPQLKNFKLTFISRVLPIPSPFSIPYRAFLFAFSYPSRSTGTFELICDVHGLPTFLRGVEHNTYHWPLRLGTSTCTKHYVRDLRPKRYTRGQQKGLLMAVIGLLFERSPAGEEIRMIVLCAILAVLAALGITANDGSSGARIGMVGAVAVESANFGELPRAMGNIMV